MESIGQKFFGWAGDPLAAGFARGMAGVFTASRAIQGRGGTMDWQQPYGDIANIYAPSFSPLRWASGFGDILCGACRHTANGLP